MDGGGPKVTAGSFHRRLAPGKGSSSWQTIAAVNSISFWPGCRFSRPVVLSSPDGGRQSLEEQPTMDRAVSLLISVGIITFGARVTAATIAKGLALGLDADGVELTVTLLVDIGHGIESHEMNAEMVGRCIDWLQQQAQAR
jgi:hypothetical protein